MQRSAFLLMLGVVWLSSDAAPGTLAPSDQLATVQATPRLKALLIEVGGASAERDPLGFFFPELRGRSRERQLETLAWLRRLPPARLLAALPQVGDVPTRTRQRRLELARSLLDGLIESCEDGGAGLLPSAADERPAAEIVSVQPPASIPEPDLLDYNPSPADPQALAFLGKAKPGLRLLVSASPPALWPANGRLASITINAVATEALDGVSMSPAVRLVSVSCDDSCVPAEDITEADYGTDDRELRVRAITVGSQRTYTITYSALSSVGAETTTAATSVTVGPRPRGERP